MPPSIRGNKGEWSEVYALFKLIADGVLKKGDSGLVPAPGEEYKILKLFKEDKGTESIYTLGGEQVTITRGKDKVVSSRSEFKSKALELIQEIKKERPKSELKNGSFILPKVEHFMNGALTYSIKAGSGSKTDLSIEILDHRTSQEQKRGFSIKSQLGGRSTLFNASGKNSCFRYRLTGKSINDALAVNCIDSGRKIQDRVIKLDELESSGRIRVYRDGPVEECLLHNLTMIDDGLPDIISSLLWNGYKNRKTRLVDACKIVAQENPRRYPFNDLNNLYTRKVKQFLVASALGMTAAHSWDGKYEATGGYIVVLRSGDIISYHFYDTAEFENYLFENTLLESPASSDKKHSYAKVIRESENCFFDLCLQVRFVH